MKKFILVLILNLLLSSNVFASDNNTEAKNLHYLIEYIIVCNPNVSRAQASSIANEIINSCNKYNISFTTVTALIKNESNFNEKVVSSTDGSMGLMGINPKAWLIELVRLGFIKRTSDLLEHKANIQCGTYILNKYVTKYGNLSLYYYCGSGPKNKLSKQYVDRVKTTESKLEQYLTININF